MNTTYDSIDLIDMNQREIKLQFNFYQPLNISTDENKDRILGKVDNETFQLLSLE